MVHKVLQPQQTSPTRHWPTASCNEAGAAVMDTTDRDGVK